MAGENKAANIPPLNPTSELEKGYFSMGAERAKKRKEDAAASLFIQPPNIDEVKILHQIFMDNQIKGKDFLLEKEAQKNRGNIVTLLDTLKTSTHWTHPQVK